MPRPSPQPRAHRQQLRPQVHRHRPQGRQPQPPTCTPKGKPPPQARRSPPTFPGIHPPPIPRQRPRSTRPEALFLHPSPAAAGTSRRRQPHKKARSASSAIQRQITSAHSAPVTALFLRLLRYSPSPSVKPVSTVLPSSKYRFAISSALIS